MKARAQTRARETRRRGLDLAATDTHIASPPAPFLTLDHFSPVAPLEAAPDAITYGAMMNACARGGLYERAINLLHEMRQAELKVPVER